MKSSFNLLTTTPQHEAFAEQLCQWYEVSARQRGTGIARRKVAYLRKKIQQGNAIIAFHQEELAGFCYIETWTHGRYVAN
ncbi:MAG: GNAT family N-acetyltransferase, partial [Bacteroidota bacterium]